MASRFFKPSASIIKRSRNLIFWQINVMSHFWHRNVGAGAVSPKILVCPPPPPATVPPSLRSRTWSLWFKSYWSMPKTVTTCSLLIHDDRRCNPLYQTLMAFWSELLKQIYKILTLFMISLAEFILTLHVTASIDNKREGGGGGREVAAESEFVPNYTCFFVGHGEEPNLQRYKRRTLHPCKR